MQNLRPRAINPNSMKDTLISIGIILVIIGGYFILRGLPFNSDGHTAALEDKNLTKISVVVSSRKYEPERIEVPLGATIELSVQNKDDEQHGLFISDFGIQETVGPRDSKTIRFVADRVGTATTSCSSIHPEKLIISVI